MWKFSRNPTRRIRASRVTIDGVAQARYILAPAIRGGGIQKHVTRMCSGTPARSICWRTARGARPIVRKLIRFLAR